MEAALDALSPSNLASKKFSYNTKKMNTPTTLLVAVLPSLKRFCIFGELSCSTLFNWDKKLRNVVVRSWLAIVAVRITQVLSILYGIVQAYFVWKSDHQYSENMLRFFLLILRACTILLRLDVEIDTTPWAIINSVLEKLNLRQKLTRKSNPLGPLPKLSELLGYLFVCIEITAWSLFLLPAILSLIGPCQMPLVLGRLFLSEKECAAPLSFSSFVVRTVISVGEFAVHFNEIIGCAFYGIFAIFMQIVMFWAQFKISHKQISSTDITQYRRLQIWEKLLNSFIKGRLMAHLMVGVSGIQIVIMIALIHRRNEMGYGEILCMSAVFLNTAFAQFLLLSACAETYKQSRRWVQRKKNMDFSLNNLQRKIAKKTLSSIRPLRVEFLDNFVDRLTPLLVQEFIWNQTISLVIGLRASG